MTVPSVSVVVPTRNRARLLRRLLEACDALDYPDLEIVIVDDGSTDETPELLRAWEGTNRLVLRHELKAGSYAARNAGWRAARGEWIAFTDDDCAPHPDWISRLVARAGTRTVAGVQGMTLARPGTITPFTHQIEQTTGGPPYRTCNILYSRAELTRQGGFDGTLRWYADNLFGLRARQAGAIPFAPDAIVLHPPRPREWRSRASWRERFHADRVYRQELHRLGVEPVVIPDTALPVVLWIFRPIVRQSLFHLRYAVRHPGAYMRGIVPMAHQKWAMLQALRDFWREGRAHPASAQPDIFPPLPADPLVSVVVVTRDRPALLGGALDALERQNWEPRETIVVDTGNGDGAGAAVARGYRAVRAPNAGLGDARGRGVQAAQGAIVAFTDDDCLPAPDWLACLVTALHHHPAWHGVQGRTAAEAGPPGTRAVEVRRPDRLYQTCNIAYRRDALDAAGGFDTGFTGWFEDTALGARVSAHGPIGWEPAARVTHRAVPYVWKDEETWLRLLRDERRLRRCYSHFYRRVRGPSLPMVVVARWLVGSPLKTLARELRRAPDDPAAYLALARGLLRERRALLHVLVRHAPAIWRAGGGVDTPCDER